VGCAGWCGLGWAWLLLGFPVGLLRQVSFLSSLFYLFSFSALISFAILYFCISGLNFKSVLIEFKWLASSYQGISCP
jgi:hypothetical protein